MTIYVNRSIGIQYCIGQPLYYGGHWMRIVDKFQVTEKGIVVGYNVILEKQ